MNWPERWKVFPVHERVGEGLPSPGERLGPEPEAGEFSRIPEAMEYAGRQVEGRWVETRDIRELHGFPVRFRNARLDLEPIFGEVVAGNTAYVFLPIESERARTVTLGLGADWWLRAWLNGEEILDTTGTGNGQWPPMIDSHRVEVELREGLNVLAVRFVSGAGTSVLMLGGPEQMAALDDFMAEAFPSPGRDQAYRSAAWSIDLDLPAVDFARGEIAGVQAMPTEQFLLDGVRGGRPMARNVANPRFEEPVRILLSKTIYPAEDLHLDAVIWLTPPEDGADVSGSLELVMTDSDGEEVARGVIEDVGQYPAGVAFSMGLPAKIAGQEAMIEAQWLDGTERVGSARAGFRVSAPDSVARSGRVPLTVPNNTGAVISGVPMTVGVPFPRGALADERNVRLLDENGREIAMQTRVSARWSRFGPIKWLLCDFTVDLEGEPARFHLEYGPDITGMEREEINVELSEAGIPRIRAGRLRAGPEGLRYDAGDGSGGRIFLGPGALLGEFVEHEDGRIFTAESAGHEVEEIGSEKAVIRRTGWYRSEGADEFCNFVTRLVLHRDSPVVRIFHTWIFTGDSSRDRIGNMGWRLPLAPGFENEGFLASFDDVSAWEEGGSLLQWDHDSFDLLDGRAVSSRPGGRAAGVAAAGAPGARLFLGIKDFWQNFPSELEFSGGDLWFHNWPRHNRPASYERPVQVGHAYRLRFAHEGEVLDFRLPEEYGGDIGEAAMRTSWNSMHYDRDNLASANAQGIARTEEIFLYLGSADVSREDGARVMRGLNDETLRAVVDPVWMSASGVFGRIHHRDIEKYPEDERIYEEVCRAPSRWADRLGIYGMWVFGDIAAWDFDLENRTSNPYRAYRKNHHGWPVRWIPFARGGQPEMLKHAERATRQMVDASFCHYADEVGDESVGPDYARRQGWWNRSLLPWAGVYSESPDRGPGRRFYAVDCDYIWHSYTMTGFHRARDVALLFGDIFQRDRQEIIGAHRPSQSVLLACLDMYRATFDPWFMVAAHALADIYIEQGTFHFDRWRPAAREYYEFTGREEFGALLRAHYDPPRPMPFPDNPNLAHHQQPAGGTTMMRIWPAVFGWRATGDPYYLRRAAHVLDWSRAAVYEGDVDYFRGIYTGSETTRRTGPGLFTGWYIQQFPLALGAFEEAGFRPDPLPTFFTQTGVREIFFRKEAGESVPLLLRAGGGPSGGEYRLSVEDAEGREVFAESWPVGERRETELPAGLPAGTYRLTVDNARALALPVAPPDVPEVFRLTRAAPGTRVAGGRGARGAMYWFRVPEGVSDFRVVFHPPDQPVPQAARMTVWNPDGERAWDRSHYGRARGVEAVVEVDSSHANRVWRITHPGWNDGFQIDPRIPPVFSVAREKWFDPEAQ